MQEGAIAIPYSCRRLLSRKKTRVRELQELVVKLSECSLGVLEYLEDNEQARKLLTSRVCACTHVTLNEVTISDCHTQCTMTTY